LASQQKIKSP